MFAPLIWLVCFSLLISQVVNGNSREFILRNDVIILFGRSSWPALSVHRSGFKSVARLSETKTAPNSTWGGIAEHEVLLTCSPGCSMRHLVCYLEDPTHALPHLVVAYCTPHDLHSMMLISNNTSTVMLKFLYTSTISLWPIVHGLQHTIRLPMNFTWMLFAQWCHSHSARKQVLSTPALKSNNSALRAPCGFLQRQ